MNKERFSKNWTSLWRSKALISRILQARDQRFLEVFLEETQSQERRFLRISKGLEHPFPSLNRGRVLDSAVLRHLPIKQSQDINVRVSEVWHLSGWGSGLNSALETAVPAQSSERKVYEKPSVKSSRTKFGTEVGTGPGAPEQTPRGWRQLGCRAGTVWGCAFTSATLQCSYLLQESAEGTRLGLGSLGGCQRSLGPQGNPRDSGFRTQELQGSSDLVALDHSTTYL